MRDGESRGEETHGEETRGEEIHDVTLAVEEGQHFRERMTESLD